MTERGISARYVEAVESFVDLARTLGDDDWAVPVPCTPGWSVRDVLSHVSGVADDGLAGRTDGAATDPWTASQVERNAHHSVDELLERWSAQYELFASAIESIGEPRPPIDCHAHEHDIRHALSRPGNRESTIIDEVATAMIADVDGLPVALSVQFDDGRTVTGGDPDGPPVSLRATAFEVFRSKLGRRSRAQVRALDWDGADADIDALVDAWFVFGPSPVDINED